MPYDPPIHDPIFDMEHHYESEIKRLRSELVETEKALVDLWKSFTPPTTKEQQQAAMDRHMAVIQRIVDRKARDE